MKICHTSIFNNSINIFVQVIFVFSFLVIFYFLYVTKVEQEDFKEQINIIIDDLIGDVKDQISQLVINKGTQSLNKEDTDLLLFGFIDIMEENITMKSKDINKTITDSNTSLKNNMYKIVIGLLISTVVLFIIFQCLPVYTIVKESVITVIFIGITELIFLTFISGKYICTDPNRIKNTLGTSIKNWIQKNHPTYN
jgi:TRAP-type uncharacterized transport system fused permease subunit